MKIELLEFEVEWPSELTVFELKNYVLSKLINYGEPLRWAITSLTNHSKTKAQIMLIEAVLILNEDKEKDINTDSN